MAVRRRRPRVVLDTNVIIAAFLSRNPASANVRVYRMWVERRLQLIVSEEIQTEYLAVLTRLGTSAPHRRAFARRRATRATVTSVRPPKSLPLSRNPFDNVFLSAAATGKARFLVTNDNDLLQIPARAIRPFRLRIVTPGDFLQRIRRSRSRTKKVPDTI